MLESLFGELCSERHGVVAIRNSHSTFREFGRIDQALLDSTRALPALTSQPFDSHKNDRHEPSLNVLLTPSSGWDGAWTLQGVGMIGVGESATRDGAKELSSRAAVEWLQEAGYTEEI